MRLVRSLATLAAGVIVLLTGCSGSHQPAENAKNPDIPVVAVAKATNENLSRTLTLTAEFRPYQEVDVMAKVAGYVKRIDVDAGDRVKQGQLLAVLEVPEMADDAARAQSMLRRSQTEVTHANDELQRSESAYKIAHLTYTRLADVAKTKAGLVAQQEVDDAQSRELVAEAQVNAAKSNVAAAEQQVQVNTAELQRVKTMTDYLQVTAPFAGVVTKRYADTGSMIQAGTSSSTQAMPVVKLSENSLLRLILPVPESAVPTVRIGQRVEVRVPVLKRTFPGSVKRFADKVAEATRTMDTEVDVENADLLLIPGMYAEVDLTLDQRNAVLTVPIPAVDASSETSGKVTVVDPDNRIVIRDVTLGMQNAASVEIRSGLHEGDLVVTGSRASLQAGEQVSPKVTETASITAQ